MNKLPIFQKEKNINLHFNYHQYADSSITHYGFIFLFLFIFFLLLLRLFQLTIVKGNYYYRLADENRIKELQIEPQRGKIIDRKGLTLANSLPADTRGNQPRLTSPRLYHEPEAIAPVVGYEQIADVNKLKNDHCIYKLQLGDKIGKKGVEKIYDCDLRGRSGKKMIEIDAKGNYLKTLTIDPPEEGKTIQLALDLELQKKAYQLLDGKKGAVVAIKPNTGEIIALVSSPSYNAQSFTDGNSEIVGKAIIDEAKPLFNRATEGTYPPGSVFKIVIAAGALEEKAIDEKIEFEDTGQIQAGPITFGNWYFLQYGKTEGMVNITRAIQRSNDIFFYKTGEKLGPEKIKLWAEKFGYGKEFNFGLGESSGLIPSPFWKMETFKDQWYLGDTYNLSIGQGYILVTPLQVTIATAAIANNGYLCDPKLLKINNPQGVMRNCKKLSISKKTLDLIQEGMRKACAPGGTGWPFFNFGVGEATNSAQFKKIQTACKTGTAESHAEDKTPHAWFTVYAPADKPEIALTVLLEEAGQGSDIAGPIAKEILKSYFERKE